MVVRRVLRMVVLVLVVVLGVWDWGLGRRCGEVVVVLHLRRRRRFGFGVRGGRWVGEGLLVCGELLNLHSSVHSLKKGPRRCITGVWVMAGCIRLRYQWDGNIQLQHLFSLIHFVDIAF
jgi:hypothetical protein